MGGGYVFVLARSVAKNADILSKTDVKSYEDNWGVGTDGNIKVKL